MVDKEGGRAECSCDSESQHVSTRRVRDCSLIVRSPTDLDFQYLDQAPVSG
jgi:hypothetical protein